VVPGDLSHSDIYFNQFLEMPDLKLFRIEKGDSQKNLVDKINQNFSNIIVFGGGPYGKAGEEGAQGDPGLTGPVGSFGSPGNRGSIWSVGPIEPSPTGGFSSDFWLDSSNFNNVYQLSSGSWLPYGFSLLGQDLFRVSEPVTTTSGNSSFSGYYLASINPELFNLVLSDSNISDGSVTANPQYSKVVVSIDGGATGKNLLEFNKSDFSNTVSFSSSTPRFFWSDRSTTNYNLSFRSGGNFLASITGNLTLNSQATNYDVNLRSSGLTCNLNSASPFLAKSTGGNIFIDLKTTGTANFRTRNIRYSSNLFTTTFSYFLRTLTTDSNPALWISNSNSGVGGLRHKATIIPSRSSRLFRAFDVASAKPMFEVYGDGEVYYNRKVDSIQPSYSVSPIGTGTVFIGPTNGVSVSWYPVVPTVAITSSVPNAIVCNNGNNFVFAPTTSGPSSNCGIYLWTPATGSAGNNPGWQNLLSNSEFESISFTVRSDSESKLIRFIGIGLGQTYNVLPGGTYLAPSGNGIFADLTGATSSGASHVDFTVVNLPTVGSISGTSRWFKVYYSAYGGNLGTMRCGVLYNQIFNSFIANSGTIFITSATLLQILPASVTLAGPSPITPGQAISIASPLFNTGTTLQLNVTFAFTPSLVTATISYYPAGIVVNGTVSGVGTSRTITWSLLPLSGQTAYQISVSGI
jgi:hypothetical protein